MKHDSRYPWFILDIFIFAALNALLIWWFRNKFIFPSSINFLQFFIFGLAIYRAADIISNETVTRPLREPFVEIKKEDGKEIQQPKKKGFLGSFGALIYCQSCSGVWVSAVLVYSYLLWPKPTIIIILILSLSGVQRFFDSLFLFLKKKQE